jgi:hypothetical protein
MLRRGAALAGFFVSLAIGAIAPAFAESHAPGVSRVSVVEHGSLVITRGDEKKTQTLAVVNAPVFAGDFLSTTDADARVEVQLDGYTVLRLGGPVQVRIAANDATAHQIEVAEGTVEVAILHQDEGPADVIAPPVSVRMSKPGDYRISVAADGTTSITARSGQAEIVTPHKTFTADAQETVIARGQAEDPTIQFAGEIAHDGFDEFNVERNRVLYAAINSDTNVPSSIASYDDLSAYGRWADVSPYGQSWIPNQSSGWAPYREGTWVWGGSYDWTWVSSEPWGWLPYHYGSWFFAQGYGWCWYPPSFSVYPVWVPGFVTFFGFGWSPFGYASFGWIPVGPYENFYPWYPWYWGYYNPWPPYHPPPPRHHRYPIHMHPGLEAYRNAAFGGASSMDAPRWRNGEVAHPVAIDPLLVANVTLQHGTLPMEPTSANLRYSPIVLDRPVRLAPVFETTRFAVEARLPELPRSAPVRDAVAQRTWERFHATRGSVQPPAVIHELPAIGRAGMQSLTHESLPLSPASHLSVPVERTALEHAPLVPVGHAPVMPTGHESGSPSSHSGEEHGSGRPPQQ